MREIVFGMEDGMVSTLGAITGIAGATFDPFTTVLAGLVIISVESISMGVGEFLSSKSRKEIDQRILHEEKEEIRDFPEEERKELLGMFIADGWPQDVAKKMVQVTSQDKELMLREMAYRELKIVPDKMTNPLKNGFIMLFSYIIGGGIPLSPYFFLEMKGAIICSIVITLIALFALGVFTSHFSKRNPIKAGFEMFALATFAAVVGYVVGKIADVSLGPK